MAPKKLNGKKRTRCNKRSNAMHGGMTTSELGSAVYGYSNSQQAVGAGSNVIHLNNPNSVVPVGGQAGGKRRKMHGGTNFVDKMMAGVTNVLGQQPSLEALKAEYDQVLEKRKAISDVSSADWIALDKEQADLAGKIKELEDATAPVPVPVPAPAPVAAPVAPVAPMDVGGGSRKRRSAKRRKSQKKKGKSAKKMRK